ncbi:DoxX family protein [Elizabethkingia anophelis]|uniref:DoxX family protein n=1 Tax=Elizabethkingia miricola TaxID=172045 RepID=A0ABD5B7Q6_ELIMR|nr:MULTISPECIES: DoxX family protein [Weeksellaceae]AVF49532.1 DoxX family protein [Elizabethkingia anophelis]AVF50154.1 DoxX family protein [Elizabethkingia anophelis]MDQ8749929.1 DoxX family protein [Elizabethkingia miricola]MDV4035684.1 DoxX family protein [Elizabethkingia anophelis]
MKNSIFAKKPLPLIIPRIIVGLIFLSEGIQKFIAPESTGAGRFAKIGFQHPEFWAAFVGITEIVCGILLLIGLLSRLASIPLLIVMTVAFISTKVPTLSEKGFWNFAHEYRTDFSMTLLLIMLLYYGGGNCSIDKYIRKRGKKS